MHKNPDTAATTSAARGSLRLRAGLILGGILVIALLVTGITRAWVADVYSVSQESMEPTLADGSRVVVEKSWLQNEPIQPGDIVVFDGEGSFQPYRGAQPLVRAAENITHWVGLSSPERMYIKRVMATGGDRIRCCDDDGHLIFNGEQLDEPYLPYQITAETPASATAFDAEIPEGRIWVMGDNRENSVDSRALLGAPGGGMISEDRVVGPVGYRIWPWTDRGPVAGEEIE